jgi:fucose permease
VNTAAVQRRLDVLSLASFVALGLPDGMLGTAWPAMRQSLHAPVGALGLVLLAATAGSVLITVFIGRILRRTGVAALLAGGLLCFAAGAAGFAAAPVFGVILGVAVLFGLAAGTMDGGLNTAVGLSGRQRLLNLLHGAYGVGTAIGPLVVTIAILTGSWRPAYVVLLIVDGCLAVAWIRQRYAAGPGSAPAPAPAPPADAQSPPEAEPRASGPARPYRAVVVAGIAVFFVYTGLEVAAGQWETTFARGDLHLSASAAGLATFGYWAALTAVRITLGLLRRGPANQRVVRWGGAVAVLAAALIWWQPGPVLTVLGFVLLGGSLAGIFPALVALTPGRLGADRAQHVIAWQVGAAAAGGAGISALVGLFIGSFGLSVLGPALTVLAGALVLTELILSRLAPAGVNAAAIPGDG